MSSQSPLLSAFEEWRHRHRQGWGLAWYLAAELCDRFYSSHGIQPTTIVQDGLGYYGIQLSKVGCPVRQGKSTAIGRLTMEGNVENWVTGSPGAHGLKLVPRLQEGEPVGPMLEETIRFLGLQPFPSQTHFNCRHKRWGDSYRLLFRVAALLAMKQRLKLNNGQDALERGHSLDPQANMKEHPGYFVFGEIVVCGDGRVLPPHGDASLWELWMRGASEQDLVGWIERRNE